MSATIQRVTPFIRPINMQGGTLYVFPSASEDLTFSFNEDPNRKFRFSKFALAKIPDITNAEPIKNTVKLQGIPGAFQANNPTRTTDNNYKFAESFQNYALNLETLITSKESYDHTNPKTISERVFFKWLKELGAIRFKATYIDNDQQILRYTEEIESSLYERVIKYIGDVDFTNNYSGQENSYSEVYVHVPTEVGDFPNVYFDTLEDENYYPGMAIGRYQDGINNEKLAGRTINDVHPAGMSSDAFYDNDSGLGEGAPEQINGTILYRKKSGKRDIDILLDNDYDKDTWWWYPTSEKNLYYTEPLEFGNPTNYDLAIVDKEAVNADEAAIRFRRSRLDGISVDFDIDSYKNENNTINNLIDIARQSTSRDFEFNAILLYYDLYENIITQPETTDDVDVEFETDGTVTYFTGENITQNVLATNLYGVLFLDNVENNISIGGGAIPSFKKCRPNSTLNLNGNAYGFKVNFKLDSSPYDSGVSVETVISNSNTLSMDIFADALNQMRSAMSMLTNYTYDNFRNDQRIRQLEDVYLYNKNVNINDIINRVKVLESVLLEINSISYMQEKNQIIELINNNYKILQDIIAGRLPSTLLINTDILVPGEGINIKKLNDTHLEFSVSSQEYNLGDIYSTSVQNDWIVAENSYSYEVLLRPQKNYLRMEETTLFTPNRDLRLYINDRINPWYRGQVFRLYMAQKYMMINQYGNFNLYIYTGDGTNQSLDSVSQGITSTNITNRNWKVISYVNAWEFQERNYRPIIEIVCVNKEKLEFKIDYLN